MALVTGLINPHQCGSLTGLSVADACNTLILEIRTLEMDKRKVSTLFPDIKGSFENVNPSSLCGILSAKGVTPYLVSWTHSFLTGRSCHLLFHGSPKVFAHVTVGTPQRSPVSPLLFVIYVLRLHMEIPYCPTVSYIDDFTLTVSSSPYRRNVQLLQRQYAILKAKGSRLAVGFTIPNTELIHWRTCQDRNPASESPIHLDGSIIRPRSKLRWLSLWFTSSLATTPHFTKRLAKAQAAFVVVKRLPPPHEWVSPLTSATGWLCTFSSPSLATGATSSTLPRTWLESWRLLA